MVTGQLVLIRDLALCLFICEHRCLLHACGLFAEEGRGGGGGGGDKCHSKSQSASYFILSFLSKQLA